MDIHSDLQRKHSIPAERSASMETEFIPRTQNMYTGSLPSRMGQHADGNQALMQRHALSYNCSTECQTGAVPQRHTTGGLTSSLEKFKKLRTLYNILTFYQSLSYWVFVGFFFLFCTIVSNVDKSKQKMLLKYTEYYSFGNL